MMILGFCLCFLSLFFILKEVLGTFQKKEAPYMKGLDERWSKLLLESNQQSKLGFTLNLYHLVIIIFCMVVMFITKGILILLPMACLAAIVGLTFFRKLYFLKKLNHQLEELFPFIYTSLKSGLTVDRALMSASEKFPEPSRHELKKIVHALQIGISLSHCFKLLSIKLKSEELQLLSFSLDLSHKTGTPLSSLLENIYQQIREKREFKRKITSLSSQGKAQGYVAMALPLLFLSAIYAVAPAMLSPLFHHPMGITLLFACGFIMLIASWLIFKITHFKEA